MENFSKVVLAKVLFVLMVSLMFVSCGSDGSKQVAKVVYVCADGKSSADGLSWDTCTAEIQDAIKQAQDNNKDLWFQSGDYNLSKTITIENKDLRLFGGFKGTENKLQDRKLDTNATILSGDNKIRVLKIDNLSSKSIMDGFVITQGKLTQKNDFGAGMHNANSDITITNTSFSKNTALFKGGAIFNDKSNPKLTNVSFTENEAVLSGGAIYNNESSPIITNASFSKNKTRVYAASIYNDKSNPIITNVTFTQSLDGGAIVNFFSKPTFINITVFKNRSTNGMAIHNESSNTIIKNSIVWDNFGGDIINLTSTSIVRNVLVVSNSIVNRADLAKACYKDKQNSKADPLLSEAKTKIINGVRHVYYDLKPNSPALNKGDNTASSETKDQIKNKRIQGATIDIGAVEKQQ